VFAANGLERSAGLTRHNRINVKLALVLNVRLSNFNFSLAGLV